MVHQKEILVLPCRRFIKGVQPPVQLSLPLGTMSNHEAEYRALLLALKYCIEHNYSTVSFRTDSQLVERAVEKEYAKNKIFAPLLDEALQYIKTSISFLLSGFQVVKIK